MSEQLNAEFFNILKNANLTLDFDPSRLKNNTREELDEIHNQIHLIGHVLSDVLQSLQLLSDRLPNNEINLN